jgi:hypothetical protein
MAAGSSDGQARNVATRGAASVPSACSTATLKGTYNYLIHGLKQQAGKYESYVEVGQETYDGDGNVATVSTNSLRRTTGRRAGTYSIRADCRGQATYAASTYDHQLYVDPSGQEASLLLTHDGRPEGALGGTETRASTQMQSAFTCSEQTLKGTFAYHARGLKNQQIYVESGFEIYDGQGNFTNTYTDSHSGTTARTTGTYDIADDCTGTATYADGEVYHLYTAPDGSMFSWLQTKGLAAHEFFGGREHRLSAKPNYALSGKPAGPKPTTAPADSVTTGMVFRFVTFENSESGVYQTDTYRGLPMKGRADNTAASQFVDPASVASAANNDP